MYSFMLLFFNCVHVTIFTSKMIYSYISKEKASFEFVSTMTPTFMLGGEGWGIILDWLRAAATDITSTLVHFLWIKNQ